MNATIESTHVKFIKRIGRITATLDLLQKLLERVQRLPAPTTKCMRSIDIRAMREEVVNLERDYYLAVASVLDSYYKKTKSEDQLMKTYYRIITGANYISRASALTQTIGDTSAMIAEMLKHHAEHDFGQFDSALVEIGLELRGLKHTQTHFSVESDAFDMCSCGAKMNAAQDVSELQCASCGTSKPIVGTIFRDEQFHPTDGQKSKHSGYDTSRHYTFWIECLQAQEKTKIPENVLASIALVVSRDYKPSTLTCADMRIILKDSRVNATSFNNHAPLLVKHFGGRPPPQLSFQDKRLIYIKFNRIAELYDRVNKRGGNKPYYPYFIYKVVEDEFKHDPEKLRLLDYIHLQSRDTVIKNDMSFKLICEAADKVDNLVYKPTDPLGRI